MTHNFYVSAILLLCILMKSNAVSIEMIESSPVTAAGTGPFWCKETQSLYYCSPFGIEYSILRYCATDGKTYSASVDGFPIISMIVPLEGIPDAYAITTPKSVEIVQWDGKSLKAKWNRTVFVAENCTEYGNNTFNVAKADKHGRLFVTSERADTCFNLDTIQTYSNLFRICAGEPPATLIKPGILRVPYGMAWNEKKDIFYLIDTCALNIMAFDYCPYTGDIWNGRIIFNYTSSSESPTLGALAIDKNGNLWVTAGSWNLEGSDIIAIDPNTGEILTTIPMPELQATGLCFGGPKLEELYVVTSAYLFPSRLPGVGPNGGRVFKVKDIGARGCKVNKAKL